MADNYVRVRCIMVIPTKDAICVSPLDDIEELWIPKSLIHGGDLLKLTYEKATEIVEFRMMAWKASELGLD